MRVRIKLDRLRELLAASRRSQNAWALRIGLSRGHWSDIVNGKHPYPSARTRMAMLDAFGLERDELFAIETTASSDSSLARSLGERYVIDREVGEGAMGRVYRARDTRFGRPVAVKVVSDEALADLGPDRFLKEIRRSARLVHPHLLPVLDAGEADGTAFLVTPFVEGGSLRDRLEREGSLPLARALSLASGIADALTHAHERGVLHGDVKPENVLLAGEHAYLTDFGLSRALHLEVVREWERRPEIDIAAGTPAYVSPEQARAEPRIDARSDVYSLGCMLFEMLAGRAPFTGKSTTEIVRRRFDAVPPDLGRLAPELPSPVVRVIAAAMALDPDRRPATPNELIERLRAAARIGAESASTSTGRTVRALEALGGWTLSRPARPRGAFVSSLFEDLRHTVRSLSQRPMFAIVAIVTLAIGIGANAAIFSVIDAVVLRPLPYEEPDRLVRLFSTYEGSLCCTISPPNYLDMRDQSRQFELAAYSSTAFSVTGGPIPERMSGYRVTAGFFELLGAEPQLGRFPGEEDAHAGAAPVVVLSDRLWRDRFDADPEALGETLVVDDVPHAVIGVTRPGFRVTGQPRLFTTLRWDPESMPSRGSNSLLVLGRPVDGISVEGAMQELETIYARLVELYPDNIVNRGVGHLSLDQWLVGEARERQLLVLWGAVGMVLLVACVNVMNLMLARAEMRSRELAIRSALGAGRWRLLRHFLTESLLIAFVGGALGLICGHLGLQALLGTFGGAVPRSGEVGLNAEVLGFALAVALLTGLLVGLVPALRTVFGGEASLREGGRGEAGGSSRLRSVLVVLEIGAALVLIVGAGLMLKSLWNLSRVDVGVEADRLLSVSVTLPGERYPDATAIQGFFESFRDEVSRLPRVEEAGLTTAAPFSGTWYNYTKIHPAGRPELEAGFVEARGAGPNYFRTLGIEVVAGRAFDGTESPDGTPVVIVNEELVRQIFPEGDPVGARIGTSAESAPWTIVGVVEDLREHGPARSVPPTMWFSPSQGFPGSMSLVVRASGDPLELVGDVRRIAADLDPQVPLYSVSRLDDMIRDGLGSRRFAMSLLGLFAGIALALGAVGTYGVMAYVVERRTREIGLRQALGATRGAVLKLVVAQGGRLVVAGILVGSIGAYLLRESLEGLLYEVSGFDAPTYAAVAATLAAIALLACLLPARRAAAVDPMEALRED